MDGQYWKGDRTMSTNEWLLTSDFWQFLEPWHGRWYEYEIFIASFTDNIYDLENERWLLGDMIDHVGINGSRVAEGLSASNVGLVIQSYYVSLVSSYGHQSGILLPVSWGSFRSWVPLGCPQWLLPGSTISHEICTEFCFLVFLFFPFFSKTDVLILTLAKIYGRQIAWIYMIRKCHEQQIYITLLMR